MAFENVFKVTLNLRIEAPQTALHPVLQVIVLSVLV
jgi:hypothetical protein